MIVMGGIVGSGIFMNPYVVARQVHTPFLILGAWTLGGLVALCGSFIYGELAARKPEVGGQYAYIRDGLNPLLAFLYGWALLLVIQSGGMAAVALTFARYFQELTQVQAADWIIAILTLTFLTAINCIGVRAGSTVQSVLMLLKIAAIVALIAFGLFAPQTRAGAGRPLLDRPPSFDLLTAFGAAMVPVLFAYGGWQTANFIAGEMQNPRKNLPVGLLIGVIGVITLYLGVNFVCVRVLGTDGLAQTKTPASDVMRLILGTRGAKIIAAGIAISTLGFLSQGMLTAPRVYFAMAEDKVFFRSVARVHPKTRVPVVAIALQGIVAIVIALSGKYEQILNYVVSADFVFFGLSAVSLFMIRRQQQTAQSSESEPYLKVPGHPATTLFFIAVSWLVVLNTIYRYPADSLIGVIIIITGIPIYFYWSRKAH
jgi:APA family basic amino acid/polyamine antiporter